MEIENEVTISTHNGSQVARQHNLRNPKVIAKEDHIDPNGHFEMWLDNVFKKMRSRSTFLRDLILEQGTGVEPAFTAWEAVVLPIYEPCILGVL